jgi:hypothetical protein
MSYALTALRAERSRSALDNTVNNFQYTDSFMNEKAMSLPGMAFVLWNTTHLGDGQAFPLPL